MVAEVQTQDEHIICSIVKPMNTIEMPISWYHLINQTAKAVHCKVFSPENGGFGCFEPLIELVCHAAHATYTVGRNWPAMEEIFPADEPMPKTKLVQRLIDELEELHETSMKHGTTGFNTMTELVDVLFFMMALGRERVKIFDAISKTSCYNEVAALSLIKCAAFIADDIVNEGYAADFVWIAIHKWYLHDLNARNEESMTERSHFADMPCRAEIMSLANEIAAPITAASVGINVLTGGDFKW